MRILLLSNRFPPDIAGGAEILAADVAKALRDHGHEVSVLTSRSHAHNGKPEPWIARTLRRVVDSNDARSGVARSLPGRTVAFYRQSHARSSGRRVRQAIKEARPDVLYVWNISGIGLLSVLRALRRIEIPIVFHLQSYWWHYINSPETQFSTTRAAWLKKLLIGPVPPLRFTSLIAISDAIKGAYGNAGCPDERIEVIDNAIDSRFFHSPRGSDRTTERSVLMYAGRLCAEKGVIVALQAVDLLVNRGDRDLELHIYGGGDPRYETKLRTFIRQRGLERVVTLHGLVSQGDLIGAYDRAEIVVVPSAWEEPFGLVAIEAMARGIPVIASDVGGLRSIIHHGVDGILVPPDDPHALAAAVGSLLDCPEERRRLSQAARREVRQRYTLDVCSRRVEQHLKTALTLSVRESRWTKP